MKLGKNFKFWIRILLALLRSLLPFFSKDPETEDEPGEKMVRAVLSVAVAENDDDDLEGIDGNGVLF